MFHVLHIFGVFALDVAGHSVDNQLFVQSGHVFLAVFHGVIDFLHTVDGVQFRLEIPVFGAFQHPNGAHHMRTVLGILRQGVRHPLQCWIAHLGQLRGKLWLWLAKLGATSHPTRHRRFKSQVVSPGMPYALQLILWRIFGPFLRQCGTQLIHIRILVRHYHLKHLIHSLEFLLQPFARVEVPAHVPAEGRQRLQRLRRQSGLAPELH
mmetsp:Transcript_23095/g.50343  ORF Transcript_23095/g.50343 Transcript_23095/m.50343 type:complete len:208 (-) Transcript_23095:337-960(-)